MACYFDNDAIQKLAEVDLLDDARSVLGALASEVFVLSTAGFKFYRKNPKKGYAKYGASIYKKIHHFIAAAQTTPVPNGKDYEALSSVAGIDAGEAILYAAVANSEADLLLTGDKVSVRSLADSESCTRVRQRLARRILCVEQVVDRVIEAQGFEYLRGKLSKSGPISDGALRLCFSKGAASMESEARAGLTSFIGDLRRQGGELLAL
jgi:hypothetical protein